MKHFVLTIEGIDYPVELSKDALLVNGRPFRVQVNDSKITVDGIEYSVELGPGIAWVNGFRYSFTMRDGHGASAQSRRKAMPSAASGPLPRAVVSGSHTVEAVMPGKILRVLVKQGDHVHVGDVICVLEAMKMENELRTQKGGTVQLILVRPGQDVEAGQPLIILS